MSTFDRAAHCRQIASLGGNACAIKHGRWHYVAIGKAGKESTIKKHGLAYWRGITTGKGWQQPNRPDFTRDMSAAGELAQGEMA